MCSCCLVFYYKRANETKQSILVFVLAATQPVFLIEVIKIEETKQNQTLKLLTAELYTKTTTECFLKPQAWAQIHSCRQERRFELTILRKKRSHSRSFSVASLITSLTTLHNKHHKNPKVKKNEFNQPKSTELSLKLNYALPKSRPPFGFWNRKLEVLASLVTKMPLGDHQKPDRKQQLAASLI